MRSLIGIEIGGTKLQIVAGTENGTISERLRFAVAPSAGGAGIREQIKNALPDFARKMNAQAIGVGFGGPVDWRTGRICCSHQIEGWSEFPLQEWLHDLTGLPARIDNDANVAALGEALARSSGFSRRAVNMQELSPEPNPLKPDLQTLFYVTLGSGVGGGLIVDKKIYHGAIPGESEIGHIRLDRSETTVESKCSGWAVDAKIRQAKLADTKGGEAKLLPELIKAGNPVAQNILAETADDLAFGLSHVVHLAHPEIIVLGGGLSLVGEPLRAAVEKSLRKYIMHAFAPGPRIALAALAEDAVPVGALALAAAANVP
jgi:glucokinase